jgi:hypothetical protein
MAETNETKKENGNGRKESGFHFHSRNTYHWRCLVWYFQSIRTVFIMKKQMMPSECRHRPGYSACRRICKPGLVEDNQQVKKRRYTCDLRRQGL